MTELTQEQLAEIRSTLDLIEADNNSPVIHINDATINWMVEKFRDALNHIDHQAARIAELEGRLEGKLDRVLAALTQPEPPAEQEFHRVFEANESLEESLAEQPEAGRDGNFSFAYIAGMLDSYAACIHEYAPADDFARWHYVPEIQEAATWLRALRPQAREAVAWRLKGYAMGGDYLFFESEGDALKCCGRNERPEPLYLTPPAAEAARLLRKVWHCRTGYGTDVCEMLAEDDYDDLCAEVETFLAQHGGRE